MSKPTLILDIGTTTISGAVLDKRSGRILACDSILNGQTKFGDDLISRIDFALKAKKNADRLHDAAASSINKLLVKLLKRTKKDSCKIEEAFCVCNTGMHHLFLGIDPAPLVTPPYRAAQKSAITVYAGRTGLRLDKNCPITFLPNIGGFVGSDALAVIISSGIYKSKHTKLAIDIGTNGELILGNKDNILVASTAAGPAFEARHISCGMGAQEGAIKSVRIKTKGIEFKVIGGASPKGICGSGLIDAVSGMLKAGLMDNSGRMKKDEFIIYKKGGVKVSVTQKDIRKLQLAKAAIYAAIKVLLRRSGIEDDDIKEVLITGAFGNTLNADSIVSIGLIPKIEGNIIRFLPRGALEGLRLYLTEPSLEKNITSILSRTTHIPLLGKGFGEEFASSLFLG